MSQIFGEDGKQVPVSVIEAGPCVVLGLSEKKIKLGFGEAREKHVKKPQLGIFKKLNLAPKKIVKEFTKDNQEYKVGQDLTVDLFKQGDFVDVTGTTIGKGFQGGMKRWNWKGGLGHTVQLQKDALVPLVQLQLLVVYFVVIICQGIWATNNDNSKFKDYKSIAGKKYNLCKGCDTWA